MKKILFSLVALVCSMSMNAQIMKVMKGNEVVATYTSDEADNVVFEEAKAPTTGTAKRTGDIEVKWVQLWENGPKFAEYNVGAANNKELDFGGYYHWGGIIDKDKNKQYNTGAVDLSGDNDTATNLWGSNWRMPTKEELKGLLDNCTVVLTYVNSVWVRKFTGKGDYASNSVTLPFGGRFTADKGVENNGGSGYYWSSSHNNNNTASRLFIDTSKQNMEVGYRYYGCHVRAVLAE